MEGVELISFTIISNVGMAKSSCMEAIRLAKTKKFEEAQAKLEEAEAFFVKGHEAHATLIQQEAAGEAVAFSLLLMHAEDQLMAADMFKSVAEEFIDVYKQI